MVDLFSYLWAKKRYTPHDKLSYVIPVKAVKDTEGVLREYGSRIPSNEGLVYWGGRQDTNVITVSMVIVPKTESSRGRVSTSQRSNFDFVRTLNRHKSIQIAQVHSHPTNWIDHSTGDDVLAAFKREGLLSIVVPSYCRRGMTPLTSCGCHRFTHTTFIRLSNRYIETHFTIAENINSVFEDLRK